MGLKYTQTSFSKYCLLLYKNRCIDLHCLCEHTLCEHTLCEHTLCEHTLCKHTLCEHTPLTTTLLNTMSSHDTPHDTPSTMSTTNIHTTMSSFTNTLNFSKTNFITVVHPEHYQPFTLISPLGASWSKSKAVPEPVVEVDILNISHPTYSLISSWSSSTLSSSTPHIQPPPLISPCGIDSHRIDSTRKNTHFSLPKFRSITSNEQVDRPVKRTRYN